MNTLEIELADCREAFEPGEELRGTVSWSLESRPRSVQVRLFWFTRGKGTADAGIVETLNFDMPRENEIRPFRFELPAGPYSFSGRLISLIWAVELVTEHPNEVTRREFVLAPLRHEIALETVESPKRKRRRFRRLIGNSN